MKVYLIYDFFSEYGGLERAVFNHAMMLQGAGLEVEILTCFYDLDVLKKMGFKDIKVTNISRIKSKHELLSLFLCYLGFNNLRRIKEGLLLSYSFPSNFMIRKINQPKINYVNHFPHFLYYKAKDNLEWARGNKGFKRWVAVFLSFFIGGYLKRLDKKLINRNRLLFVNSKFTKRGLERLYGRNFVLSYPPLDSVFKPSSRKTSEQYIFSSSRIVPAKKYEWLIKSVSLMKNKIPLYLSGQCNESYKRELVALSKQYGVTLKFLGRLSTEELVDYYSSARAYAFPTPYFGFGLVPAESLACGTPIVVWKDGGGQNEQLIDGVNGFGAKPHDFKDFADKLDLLADGKFKQEKRELIINSSKIFSYESVKKEFLAEIFKVIHL